MNQLNVDISRCWNGSVDRGTYHQAQRPVLDSWDPHGGREEQTPAFCFQTPNLCALLHFSQINESHKILFYFYFLEVEFI